MDSRTSAAQVRDFSASLPLASAVASPAFWASGAALSAAIATSFGGLRGELRERRGWPSRRSPRRRRGSARRRRSPWRGAVAGVGVVGAAEVAVVGTRSVGSRRRADPRRAGRDLGSVGSVMVCDSSSWGAHRRTNAADRAESDASWAYHRRDDDPRRVAQLEDRRWRLRNGRSRTSNPRRSTSSTRRSGRSTPTSSWPTRRAAGARSTRTRSRDGMHPVELEPSQLEYLQGLERKVGGVLVAYRRDVD